jgi:hypothetical protein
MSARKALLGIAAACCAAAALMPTAAAAAPAPAWAITLTPMPSNFAAGAVRTPRYLILATNVGGADTDGTTTVVKVTLPVGLKPVEPSAEDTDPRVSDEELACKIEAVQTIVCETDEVVGPSRVIKAETEVEVEAGAVGPLTAEASVSGGGAAQQATASFPTEVKGEPLPFGFLPGFQALLNDEEGEAVSQAASHPYQQTITFGLPTQSFGVDMSNAGHARDIYIELPRGMAGSSAASARLCSEVQLTGGEGCPVESQVGIVNFTTLVGRTNIGIASNDLYNMVPPPGAAAELATDLADGGIFIHILVGLRSDSDYGLEAASHDILALGTEPIFGVQAQVWGDPSGDSHDHIRGDCPAGEPEDCEVTQGETPFLTLPRECPHQPPAFGLSADSWEEPSPPFAEREIIAETPELTDCAALKFNPSIRSRPTTNLSDSPSGLDFALHQPQEEPRPDPLEGQAPGILKDAVIHFPAGMAVNPSQAGSLGACGEEEIGFEGQEGSTLLFSKAPQGCPNAAKIGTVEATSPALVARKTDEKHEVETDPEGNPVLEVLHGSVYVAEPFANPFDSLIAAYLVIEDEKTGIVAKLAGEGELDPRTGQITTRFRENPEQPIEDIRVHLFGGPRGTFTTPPRLRPPRHPQRAHPLERT